MPFVVLVQISAKPFQLFSSGKNKFSIVIHTELKGEILMPAEWKDGVRMELALWDDQVEIKTKSIHTGISYPRGYYRFPLD